MKKQGELTHKEAVRKALEMLGGKAQLKQIYPVAIKLIGKNTRSVDIKATIRRELNSSPYDFKATPNVEGSWELISFQEEIDKRDKIIERKDEEIEQLRGVRTDCDFIQFFLEDLMEAYKYDRKGLNPIRVILKNRGYNDAVAVLDAWIDEKEDELAKALKKAWPGAKHQRCLFHVFCQVKRYTTSRPKTAAGLELYMLAKDLLHLASKNDADLWTHRFIDWIVKYKDFLGQMTRDEHGVLRPTHERLIKAEHSLIRLLRERTMFTYLDEALRSQVGNVPSTTNMIEGGINSQLRAMLRDHRGLSVERRIKAVFWWCYMHSPRPLSATELLKVMPSDKSISDIYNRMSARGQLEYSIPNWGDAVVWSDLHRSSKYPDLWG